MFVHSRFNDELTRANGSRLHRPLAHRPGISLCLHRAELPEEYRVLCAADGEFVNDFMQNFIFCTKIEINEYAVSCYRMVRVEDAWGRVLGCSVGRVGRLLGPGWLPLPGRVSGKWCVAVGASSLPPG